MICKHCGTIIEQQAALCPKCGEILEETVQAAAPVQERTEDLAQDRTSDLTQVQEQVQAQLAAQEAEPEAQAEEVPSQEAEETPAETAEATSEAAQAAEETAPAEPKPSLIEKWKAAMARKAQERAARKQAQQEAKEKAEQEAREKAQQEAKEKAEQEAREKAQQEAQAQQEKAPEQQAQEEAPVEKTEAVQAPAAPIQEKSPQEAPQEKPQAEPEKAESKAAPADPAALRRPQMPEKLPTRRSTDPTAVSIRTEKHIERILVRQVKLHKRISIMAAAALILFAVCALLFAILLVQVMGLKAENAMLMDRLDEIDEHVLATEPPPTEPIVVPIPPEFTEPEEPTEPEAPTDENGDPIENEPETHPDSPITITKQPTNEKVSVWTDLSASIFTVTAEGENLTFQWQKWDKEDAKWNNIQTGSVYLIYSNDNQTALMLAKFTEEVYGKYRCVIENEDGGHAETQFAEIQKP